MVFIIIIYALTLRYIDEYKDMVKPAVASVIVFLLFIFIVLLIDILAIILFLRDALKPGTFLIMNCFQTTFWAVILLMNFVAVGRGANAAGIAFSIFVFLTFVGLLVYSIVGYQRAKKAVQRGQYVPAHNPAVPVPGSTDHNAPPYQQSTAYASPAGGATELESHYLPSYHSSAAGDYHQQSVKAAHVV